MAPISCGKGLQTLISTSGDVSHIGSDKSDPLYNDQLERIWLEIFDNTQTKRGREKEEDYEESVSSRARP